VVWSADSHLACVAADGSTPVLLQAVVSTCVRKKRPDLAVGAYGEVLPYLSSTRWETMSEALQRRTTVKRWHGDELSGIQPLTRCLTN